MSNNIHKFKINMWVCELKWKRKWKFNANAQISEKFMQFFLFRSADAVAFHFFSFIFPISEVQRPPLKWKRKMQRKSMGSWLSWRMLDLSHITHTQWGTNCSQLDVAGCLKVFGTHAQDTPYILLRPTPDCIILGILIWSWGHHFVGFCVLFGVFRFCLFCLGNPSPWPHLYLLLFYSLLCSKLSRQRRKVFFKKEKQKIICEKKKVFWRPYPGESTWRVP